MRMPNVICIGFEKCATTHLDMLFRHHGEFQTPAETKETRFFNYRFDQGVDWYASLYGQDDDVPFRVDVTPSYVRSATALERIRDLCGDKAKIIVCLRNPVLRAFSHYVHDLRHHYSVFGQPLYLERLRGERSLLRDPYDLSFFDSAELACDYHFTRYAAICGQAVDIFGRDNVLFLISEQDFADLARLRAMLARFLDYPELRPFAPVARQNENFFPCYVFSASKDLHMVRNGALYRFQADILYLIRGTQVDLFTDLSAEKCYEIVCRHLRWSRSLPAEQARKLYQSKFADDEAATAAITGRDLSCWRSFGDTEYRVIFPDQEVFETQVQALLTRTSRAAEATG